ncbi:MAG: hypothetical protein Q6370_010775 [Candidatus Sigynarchaeota archaeon]|jgi:hypothetical protein
MTDKKSMRERALQRLGNVRSRESAINEEQLALLDVLELLDENERLRANVQTAAALGEHACNLHDEMVDSHDALRSQLATVTAERDALRAELRAAHRTATRYSTTIRCRE